MLLANSHSYTTIITNSRTFSSFLNIYSHWQWFPIFLFSMTLATNDLLSGCIGLPPSGNLIYMDLYNMVNMLPFSYWLLLSLMFKIYPLQHESALPSVKLSRNVLLCGHAVSLSVLVTLLLVVMKQFIKSIVREKGFVWALWLPLVVGRQLYHQELDECLGSAHFLTFIQSRIPAQQMVPPTVDGSSQLN